MFNRSIWQIRKNLFPLLSLSPRCFTNKFASSNGQRFFQTSNSDKKQSYRHFSTSTSLSTETKEMDGAGDQKILNADYEEVVKTQKEKDALIIDVREQTEINETGKLPGSIHIPMGDVKNSLATLSDEEFKNKFEKSKPHKNTKIIVSCRSGMRSAKVQEEMRKLGYENVYNYNGGWLDWESRQKV